MVARSTRDARRSHGDASQVVHPRCEISAFSNRGTAGAVLLALTPCLETPTVERLAELNDTGDWVHHILDRRVEWAPHGHPASVSET